MPIAQMLISQNLAIVQAPGIAVAPPLFATWTFGRLGVVLAVPGTVPQIGFGQFFKQSLITESGAISHDLPAGCNVFGDCSKIDSTILH